MDLEAPADAWYVWIGVTLVSIALAGVVLSLPSQPPPDAYKAASTVDSVASQPVYADATYDHEGDEVRIDTTRISLRNEHGTASASIAFGPMTPVNAVDDAEKRDAFQRILDGERPQAVVQSTAIENQTVLTEAASDARAHLDANGADWQLADGRIEVQKRTIGNETLVLVGA